MTDESVQAAKDQLFADHETQAACAAAVRIAQANLAAATDALTFALNAETNAVAAIHRSGQALQTEMMSTNAAVVAAKAAPLVDPAPAQAIP